MKFTHILKTALPFVWFGAVCAISFMEAPLKFNAPHLTTPVALEVGHIVFDALNKVEWVLCGLLCISLFVSRSSKFEYSAFAVILLILVLQTFWLFPILDERTLAAINSRPLPASDLHLIYIALELIKVLLLPVLGTMSMRNMLKSGVQATKQATGVD